MRRYVIGDIHGCSKALRTLIECLDPQPEDEVIFLGDYVDRGPDSRGVIDQIIDLKEQCRVVALRGNHEIMLQGVAFGGLDPKVWMGTGGKATVTSYGGSLKKIPKRHREFFESLLPHYETEDAIFVHANYDAFMPMENLPDEIRYWTHLSPAVPQPHFSGKRVFVGHTPQPNGVVLDLGYLVCVDTYCFGNGYLTAMNLANDTLIQVDKKGFRRRVPAEALMHFIFNTCKAVSRKLKPSGGRAANAASDTKAAAKGRTPSGGTSSGHIENAAKAENAQTDPPRTGNSS